MNWWSGLEFGNIDSFASSMKGTFSVFARNKNALIFFTRIKEEKTTTKQNKKIKDRSTSQRFPKGHLGKQEITRQGKTIGTHLSRG